MRPEVEVLVLLPDLERDPPRTVAVEQEDSVAEHATHEIRIRIVDDDEVYAPLTRALEHPEEVGRQVVERTRPRRATQHCHVHVAVRPRLAARDTAEDPRGDTVVATGERFAEGIDTGVHGGKIPCRPRSDGT